MLHVFELVLVSSTKVLNMDDTELQKSVCRQPSLRNLTQVDYGKPKPQQNKVRTCELNIQFVICLFPTFQNNGIASGAYALLIQSLLTIQCDRCDCYACCAQFVYLHNLQNLLSSSKLYMHKMQIFNLHLTLTQT